MKWLVILNFIIQFNYCFSQIQKKPHIIFIMADDMGFNDVGFHGSNEIPTPNIDALAYNGVILNSHYTQALCTPSRTLLFDVSYQKEETTSVFASHSLRTKIASVVNYTIINLTGFNDVGFHGSNEIPTPNIDALAYNGVILNSHYTQALCTPSRASLLTGKYPINIGMQHMAIWVGEPWGLPLNETLLPEYLKRNGYVTRALGKWHLGFHKKEYTPTFRGFDSHYGYWQGYHSYYDHMSKSPSRPYNGYDFRSNLTVDWDAKGKYSTTLFTDEAVNIIQKHNTENPLFLYFAHLAPHYGSDWSIPQAPDEEIARFAHIRDPQRRIYAAMVSMLDKSVGTVITALREKHMLENSIIVFMSDNGAPTQGAFNNRGSNYPFRGIKNSVWEGALRNIAAVWSPLIKKPKRVQNNLMHISDWLPTLFSAAGLDSSQLPSTLDGKDQWKVISQDEPSSRNEILHNIDDILNYAAIRRDDWKYLYGSVSKGKMDNWYGSTGKDQIYRYDEETIINSKVGKTISSFITYQQIKERNEHLSQPNFNNYSVSILDIKDIENLRKQAIVTCKNLRPEDQNNSNKCNPLVSGCLFNIKDDPCEMINLASQRPDMVNLLNSEIGNYRKTAKNPVNVPVDPNCDPVKFNGTWTYWQDADDDKINEKNVFSSLSNSTIGIISAGCIALFFILIIASTMLCRRYPELCKTQYYIPTEKNIKINL